MAALSNSFKELGLFSHLVSRYFIIFIKHILNCEPERKSGRASVLAVLGSSLAKDSY